MDNLIDLAANLADFAREHLRGLLAFIVGLVLLFGANAALHHLAQEQAAQATMFDRLTKPLPAAAAPRQAPNGTAAMRDALGD